MEKSDTVETSTIIGDEEFIEVNNNPIVGILSYSVSANRNKIAVCTQKGFCLVDINNQQFVRYQDGNSPFKQEQECRGVQLSALMEVRQEICLVPQKDSKKFKTTYVYIFDYNLRSILYSNNFFLNIKQLAFNEESLIVASCKRILIYNYIDDYANKNQKYYLNLYLNQEENNRVRYLSTYCEEKNNSQINCECGTFCITEKRPFKLVYVRVSSINKISTKSLIIFEQKFDKQTVFDSFPDEKPFYFTISSNGKFLAYSQNSCRNIKIYNLEENCLLCMLWLGRRITRIISQGFLQIVEIKDSEWFTVIREKENGAATMHMFKIEKKSPAEQIESKFKRYFSLFPKTLEESCAQGKIIGPDFYLKNGVLYTFSLCGAIFTMIDFKRSGNHVKKTVDNLVKWNEIN